MNRDEFIMKCVNEHYLEACSLGYEVVGVFLQGSQNYEMDCYDDDYTSDIDTKCIILPTLADVVNGTMPYSSTHIRSNNEHIDIKDIRVMIDMFKKQNIAYLEILFTKYFVVNKKYKDLIDDLRAHANDIVNINKNLLLKAIAGTSFNKYKDLEHPFPTVMDKINKFGYDPKQLHHILRLNDFLKKYISGVPFKDCLIPDNKDYLLQVKKGILSLDTARQMALRFDSDTKQLVNINTLKVEKINKNTLKYLDKLKLKFIKRHLVEELFKDN